jgi:hypothetical protein
MYIEHLKGGLLPCPPKTPTPTSSFGGGGGEPLDGAHLVTPTPASTIDCISMALDNLALATSNDTTVLQQPMAANLVLTTSVASLTTANKKLAEALAKEVTAKATGTGGALSTNTPLPGIYCWTHGHWVSQRHTSAACENKAAGHKDDVTSANTMGSSGANKEWFART